MLGMADNFIEECKRTARAFTKGLDSSYKLKYNSSFTKVLDLIENNQVENEKELKHKLDLIYIRTCLSLRRQKGGKAKEKWLEQSAGDIYGTFYTYFSFDRNFYSIDEEAIKYFQSKEGYVGLDKAYETNFVIEYNRSIYLVEVQIKEQKIELYLATPVHQYKSKKYVSYSFNAELTVDDNRELNIKIIPFKVSCNNSKCPRYKQCIQREQITRDGVVYKEVNCDDIKKCDYVVEAGKLSMRALTDSAINLLCYMCNRVYPVYNREKKEYEHIPMPENMNKVKIYLGAKQSDEVREAKETKGIVGSHASPREHKRRGGVRRGYYRKDGTYVKPTTFKPTTVNKGHTKCSYEIKG